MPLKYIKYFIVYIFLVFTAGTKCDKECKYDQFDYRLKFVNNSSMNLYLIHTPDYPDTNVSNISSQESKYRRSNDCGANSTAKVVQYCTWENFFKNSPSGIVMIFVFKDTLNKSGTVLINEIVKYPFLKRYDLTYDNIVNMNWKINYP